MIFPIIFAIAGLFFGWSAMLDGGNPHGAEYAGAAIMALLFAFSGLLIGILVAFIVGCFFPKSWLKSTVFNLAAMRNGSAAHGIFYLMRGSVNGGWAYNYYVKEGVQLRPKDLLINENDILVEEIEEGEPRLEVSVYDFSKEWFNWFGAASQAKRYHFFVPKGSVKEGFDI